MPSANKKIKNHIVNKVVKMSPQPDPMAARSTSLPIRTVPLYFDNGGSDDFFEAQVGIEITD